MALRSLFRSARGSYVPPADAANREGAPAYRYTPEHSLAQLVSTGCLAGTFYASAEEQIETLLRLAEAVEPEFVAKAAVHARERGRMKDAPAVLVASLSRRAPGVFERAFARVVDDGRMLRTFVQVVRSGRTGRKSLGSRPKRLVRAWLAARSDEALFRASTGRDPSLADVLRMVHPKPETASRSALYAWLVDRPHDAAALPEPVRAFEAWKADPTREIPDVPFLMLTARPLDASSWARIARRLSWQSLRMNLATLVRHGAFESDPALAAHVAARLSDPGEVRRSRVYPYQLLSAWKAAGDAVPAPVRAALQDALEASIENVPALPGRVHVAVDVSGSMASPVTGGRGSGTTSVSCRDVAAVFACAILRKNPEAEVIPFHDRVVPVPLNPRDSIATNAAVLEAIPSGGTNCSAPLVTLNARGKHAKADLVIYLSDNQSWVDVAAGRGTAMLEEWRRLKVRNPKARLACIDLQPCGTTQAPEADDVLNVGGFSDAVFDLVGEFARGELAPEAWAQRIRSIDV
jgi:60 kDa SS-A/Ro ribonucleoprotein